MRPGNRQIQEERPASIRSGLSLVAVEGSTFSLPAQEITMADVLAGFLEGFGARIGGGCTSGHGVCGIARLSIRSIVATTTFIATAIAVVAIMRHGLGA